jgi:hypothetical protein
VEVNARQAEPLDAPVELAAEVVGVVRPAVSAREHEASVVVRGAERRLVFGLTATPRAQCGDGSGLERTRRDRCVLGSLNATSMSTATSVRRTAT